MFQIILYRLHNTPSWMLTHFKSQMRSKQKFMYKRLNVVSGLTIYKQHTAVTYTKVRIALKISKSLNVRSLLFS